MNIRLLPSATQVAKQQLSSELGASIPTCADQFQNEDASRKHEPDLFDRYVWDKEIKLSSNAIVFLLALLQAYTPEPDEASLRQKLIHDLEQLPFQTHSDPRAKRKDESFVEWSIRSLERSGSKRPSRSGSVERRCILGNLGSRR